MNDLGINDLVNCAGLCWGLVISLTLILLFYLGDP